MTSSWASSRQRHGARYQGQDATIYYPFHPHCGRRVAVVRRHSFRSVTMLVIEQPDGTMALVPEWMTRPAAAAVEIREAPRFPLAELRALRQVVVAVLSLPSDRGNGDRHGILHTPRSAGAFPESGTEDITAASGDRAAGASRRTAVAVAATLARGLAPEGAAWRAVLHRGGRLPQGAARPYRDRSGSAGSRGHRPGIPQVRRVPQRAAGASVAAPGRDSPSGRRAGASRAADRMEITGLQHGPASADPPDLR